MIPNTPRHHYSTPSRFKEISIGIMDSKKVIVFIIENTMGMELSFAVTPQVATWAKDCLIKALDKIDDVDINFHLNN